jgi:serine/threonine-protein kinase
MAPEQATGQHDKVDERTDLFALGAIVHEMITGQPAFSGANIPEVVFKVVYEQPAPLPAGTPPAVVAAVERAMAKKQDDRFPDVGAFVEALTGQPLPVTRNPSIPPTGGRTPSRNTGKEAFEQTVGSGDHGPTALPPSVKTGERARDIITNAPTLGADSTPPGAETKPPMQHAPAPTRSRAPLIALVAGGIAIAAGIAFFVAGRRGAHEDAPLKAPVATVDEQPEPVAVESPPKHETITPPAPQTPEPPKQQTTKPQTAEPATKQTPEPPTHSPEPPKPPPKHVDDTDDDSTPESPDDETPTRLAGAETALASRDYARAEQLANAVINGEHRRPGPLARAHVVHGIVECAAHNDRGLALADLRAISSPRLRKKLVEGCQAAGMTLDQ